MKPTTSPQGSGGGFRSHLLSEAFPSLPGLTHTLCSHYNPSSQSNVNGHDMSAPPYYRYSKDGGFILLNCVSAVATEYRL